LSRCRRRSADWREIVDAGHGVDDRLLAATQPPG
jgi:hypothetical protein